MCKLRRRQTRCNKNHKFWRGLFRRERIDKFKTLNGPFSYPVLEEFEILTNQDIPNGANSGALFNAINWLKKFSAPNVASIGDETFNYCENLASVDFPNITSIGNWVFDA